MPDCGEKAMRKDGGDRAQATVAVKIAAIGMDLSGLLLAKEGSKGERTAESWSQNILAVSGGRKVTAIAGVKQ